MCPPALPPSPAEIGLLWTEEQVILSLDEYIGGSCLPNNVLADLSPYRHRPSDLPGFGCPVSMKFLIKFHSSFIAVILHFQVLEYTSHSRLDLAKKIFYVCEEIWYLVASNEKRESVYGFWKAKGEPCLIYSNSAISGWRTLLEYFEGQAPHGQRTDWLMQEYSLTQKELCDNYKPKVSKLLCRVFLCSGHSSKMQAKDCQTDVKPKQTNSVASLIPKSNFTSPQDLSGESKANREFEVGLFPMTNRQPNSNQLDLSELECLSRGDFLELDDLEDPESHFTSSQNSSCPSKLSDEYFDSMALLRDLEEDDDKQMLGKYSTSSYFLTTSLRPDDVVFQPSLLASTGTSAGIVNDSPPSSNSAVHENFQDKTVQDQSTKRLKLEQRNEGTSNFSHALAPSNGEKKVGSGRMKRLTMYFCFTPF